MAAEARAAPSRRMYGKSPKIERESEAERKADGEPAIKEESAKGDPDKSGKMKEAHAAAEKTAGKPVAEGAMDKGGKAEADVMAGTAGIPTVHHDHATDRAALHARHQMESADLHHKQEREHILRITGNHADSHEAMHDRHHREMKHQHASHEKEFRDLHSRHEEGGSGEGPSGGVEEKEVGKSGSQPAS